MTFYLGSFWLRSSNIQWKKSVYKRFYVLKMVKLIFFYTRKVALCSNNLHNNVDMKIFFQNFFSPNRLRFITNILLLELNKGLDWERERGEKEFFDRLLTIFYAPNAHSSSVRHELNWHQGVVYPMRERLISQEEDI